MFCSWRLGLSFFKKFSCEFRCCTTCTFDFEMKFKFTLTEEAFEKMGNICTVQKNVVIPNLYIQNTWHHQLNYEESLRRGVIQKDL